MGRHGLWIYAGIAGLSLLGVRFGARFDSSADTSLAPGVDDRDRPPSPQEQVEEWYQCSRQCRWQHGPNDMRIVGKRTMWLFDNASRGSSSSIWRSVENRAYDFTAATAGRYCRCFKLLDDAGKQFEEFDGFIPRFSSKAFDSKNTWSGKSEADFASSLKVCLEKPDSTDQVTFLQEDVEHAVNSLNYRYLHCGACAMCSSLEDIEVLARTRKWITEVMTKVSADFAAPWGHHDPVRLANNLFALGMNFSRTSLPNKPSCMDCWTDNIMCDSMTCKSKCWVKFFNAANQKTEITGDIRFWQFNKKCLRCDEDNCGPAFIKCAGANRRSSGIESDIQRPDWQKCRHGVYSGVDDGHLPTDPMPTQDEIRQVLSGKSS
eukprot:gnl/TRDRNA2_/TRDRNA2_175293_c0_seq10.p1 gnl/TRDRNA2_/TRDRNA2_175293_c0~~gnl/TRDRNA2_/TRDRNA2_175293_c0_seq10.p1  ORF type:complete len:376 (-),score=50.55 gnl/TRDRNA2_/TRDRNA2_175293_c0_seq10:58-1185(-)